MPRVYVSLPLSGPHARAGRDVLRGARLAWEPGPRVELEVVVSWAHDPAETARRAAADPDALAYLGDFHSSHVSRTSPILGEAGLLQVAPVATWIGLGGPTLVRISPHDGVGAQVIAEWCASNGVRSALVVHDHDAEYGTPVGQLCAAALAGRGIAAECVPVWDRAPDPAALADALLYVGVAGSGAVALWDALHELRPQMWLLGHDGLAQHWFARELAPGAAERTRLFVAHRATLGFYGYEAMSLVLDSLRDDRATVQTALATRDRDSVIGRYSIGPDGHTTTTAYGRVAVIEGQLAWDGD